MDVAQSVIRPDADGRPVFRLCSRPSHAWLQIHSQGCCDRECCGSSPMTVRYSTSAPLDRLDPGKRIPGSVRRQPW